MVQTWLKTTFILHIPKDDRNHIILILPVLHYQHLSVQCEFIFQSQKEQYQIKDGLDSSRVLCILIIHTGFVYSLIPFFLLMHLIIIRFKVFICWKFNFLLRQYHILLRNTISRSKYNFNLAIAVHIKSYFCHINIIIFFSEL